MGTRPEHVGRVGAVHAPVDPRPLLRYLHRKSEGVGR